jgi:hypothetical protein
VFFRERFLTYYSLHKSVVTVVPDLSGASTNAPMADLKSRCDDARPLGLVRCDADELLVIYDSKSFSHCRLLAVTVSSQLLDVILQNTVSPAVRQVISVGKPRQLSLRIVAAMSFYSLRNSLKFEM